MGYNAYLIDFNDYTKPWNRQLRNKTIFSMQQGEGEGEEILFPQVASEWRQEKEDEEGGLLRDRYFITFYLLLRRALHNF